MTTTTPQINSWTDRNGNTRRYINNWQNLAGIEVTYRKNGHSIWDASIRDFDHGISNNQAYKVTAGKVWIDADDVLHFDYHSGQDVMSIEEKRTRIVAALADHDVTAK